LLWLSAAFVAAAQDQADPNELVKQVHNPLTTTTILELQPNFNFGVGPGHGTESVFNLQLNVPFALPAEWSALSRTIVPLSNEPGLAPGEGYTFGLGDIQQTLFISPPSAANFIWGFGPVLQLPTATAAASGTGKFELGPTIAALASSGPWQAGGQLNNLWSFAGHASRPAVSKLLFQPVVNYALSAAWVLTFAPIVTADWKADARDRWTVPLGAGIGRVFSFGPRAVSVQAEAYGDAVHPSSGPRWSLILTIQLLLPRK
jgi:hypothetical protein